MMMIDPATLTPAELAIYRAGQKHDAFAINRAHWFGWMVGIACGLVIAALVGPALWRVFA